MEAEGSLLQARSIEDGGKKSLCSFLLHGRGLGLVVRLIRVPPDQGSDEEVTTFGPMAPQLPLKSWYNVRPSLLMAEPSKGSLPSSCSLAASSKNSSTCRCSSFSSSTWTCSRCGSRSRRLAHHGAWRVIKLPHISHLSWPRWSMFGLSNSFLPPCGSRA